MHTESVPPRPARVLYVAACALVDRDGRVLLAQRPEGKAHAGQWEFPGGKIEDGETPEAALIRELREELTVEPCETCLEPFAFASRAYPDFHLFMPLFVCRRWDGFVRPTEGQNVTWVPPNEIARFDMPPADRDLAGAVMDRLSGARV